MMKRIPSEVFTEEEWKILTKGKGQGENWHDYLLRLAKDGEDKLEV